MRLKISFLLLALVAMNSGFAQGPPSTQSLENFIFSSGRSALPREVPKDVEGSAYLQETFKKAKIYKGDEFINVYARYNVYSDLFEVKREPTEDYLILNKSSEIDVEIEGDRYRFLDNSSEEVEGYVEIIHQFDNGSSILKKYIKDFKKEERSRSSYDQGKPPRFVNSTNLYYITPKGRTREIENSWRTLRKVFDPYRKEIKSYVKENDIDFDDDYQGLIKVMDFIHDLMP